MTLNAEALEVKKTPIAEDFVDVVELELLLLGGTSTAAALRDLDLLARDADLVVREAPTDSLVDVVKEHHVDGVDGPHDRPLVVLELTSLLEHDILNSGADVRESPAP